MIVFVVCWQLSSLGNLFHSQAVTTCEGDVYGWCFVHGTGWFFFVSARQLLEVSAGSLSDVLLVDLSINMNGDWIWLQPARCPLTSLMIRFWESPVTMQGKLEISLMKRLWKSPVAMARSGCLLTGMFCIANLWLCWLIKMASWLSVSQFWISSLLGSDRVIAPGRVMTMEDHSHPVLI